MEELGATIDHFVPLKTKEQLVVEAELFTKQVQEIELSILTRIEWKIYPK